MKLKNIIYLMAVAMMALFTGCARSSSSGDSDEEGYLILALKKDDVSVNVKSTPLIYSVKIISTDGSVVASYADHTAMPEKVKLKVGKYTVEATHGGNVNAGFDAPYYYGKKDISVVANVTTNEEIVCTLANIKVTVTYSDAIKQNFTTYDVVINNGENGIITFTKADEGRAGYLKIPTSNPKTITWNLNLVNNQGDTYTATRTITGVAARDFYKFHFDISQTPSDNQGAFGLEINVDEGTDEIDHSYDINLKKKPAPVFTSEGFDLASPVMVNETIRGVQVKLNIASAATLQDLSISHSNDYLSSIGIPRSLSFVTGDAAVISAVASKGITVSSPITDAATAWVDMSALANTLPLGEYEIAVVAYDAQRQQVSQNVTIIVLPDQDHMPLSSTPWGQFATVKGQWNTISMPEGLVFQYRKDGENNWTDVAASETSYDESTKVFTATIHRLSPSTKYYYRTYSTQAGGSETELTFTTEATPDVANLSFDTWSSDGNKYYPNADKANSFWATGNEGTALAGKGSTATPSSDVAVAGDGKQAARLVSVGGVMVAKHAAGNIYLGTYKTNLSDPRSSAVMGRPYTGRPIGMKGYYKYTTKPITVDKDNKYPQLIGTNDKCHIYITLEDWGGATTRPDNPTVIAHGELMNDQNVASYTPFKIMLTYYDKVKRPTHITIAATTSYLGADFCGGDGCELFVDEFELIFDDVE